MKRRRLTSIRLARIAAWEANHLISNGGELARALRAAGMDAISTVRSPAVPRPGRGRARRVVAGTLLAVVLGAGAWLALERTARPALAFNSARPLKSV